MELLYFMHEYFYKENVAARAVTFYLPESLFRNRDLFS